MITDTAYIALGSNLGDRLAQLRDAVRRLDAYDEVRVDFAGGIASVWVSSPVGVHGPQDHYFNTAIPLRTTLSPHDLLACCLNVERAMGRRRKTPGEPRIIDVDVLLIDGRIVDDAELVLPHPRLHERRFVLEPLAEIAADLVHPVLHRTVGDLAAALRGERTPQSVRRYVTGAWWRAASPSAP